MGNCVLNQSYHNFKKEQDLLANYQIGGVMVSVLAWSVVDRGFKPRSSQTKDYEIGVCCFFAKE
jgi:hypothetical protein